MAKEYINHLDKKWCKLTMAVIKRMKEEYYQLWHFDTEHITDFIQWLDEDQQRLTNNSITISDKDKMQHFVEQMYASGMFDVQQMQMWEKQPEFDKTWKDAKEYFEELVDAIETYQVNSRGMAGRARYESTANMAEEEYTNQSDELRAYLKTIVAKGEAGNARLQQMTETMASVVALTNKFCQQIEARNKREAERDAQIATLMKQMQQLAEATMALTNKLNASGGAISNMNRNMGGTPTAANTETTEKSETAAEKPGI